MGKIDFTDRMAKLRVERRLLVLDLVNEAKDKDGTYQTAKDHLYLLKDEGIRIDSDTDSRLDQMVCPIGVLQDAERVLEREFKEEIEKHKSRVIWDGDK